MFGSQFSGAFSASLVIEADEPGRLTELEVVEAVAGLQNAWDDVAVVGTSLSYADLAGLDSAEPPAGAAEVESHLTAMAASPSGGVVGTLINDERQRANLQLLLRDGDNQSMQMVLDRTDDYLLANPLPEGVRATWGGETYLNLVWQDKMVNGMTLAFASTLAVVLVLLFFLFRSVIWALLGTLPMLATILVVYGFIGYSGRDYDMPTAVLSTLVLGIGVDFAIHFIQRFREFAKEMSAAEALRQMYEEPGRAITRNALVIALGFVPLIFSSLIPYVIVGLLLSSIMILSWLGTMVAIPAMITAARAMPVSPRPPWRPRLS